MHCPFCAHDDTKVNDSRLAAEGTQIRRRRECLACGERFTTFDTEVGRMHSGRPCEVRALYFIVPFSITSLTTSSPDTKVNPSFLMDCNNNRFRFSFI